MELWWLSLLPLLVLLLILYPAKKKRKVFTAQFIKRKKERRIMQELAKRFIGKDCYINLLDGTVDGVLREVTDGGLVVEKNGKQQAVNIDYVIKISEYPHNKKGKRAVISGE